MASTSKPNGISLTRDGNLKFTVSWKVTDRDYSEGQQARIRAKRRSGTFTAWQSADVASNFTTKSFTFSASDYNPTKSNQIEYIEVNVRGKRGRTTASGKTTIYDWSDWAVKTLTITAPRKPTAETELTSTNASTFAWNVATSTNDNRPFVQTQWQTILKKACKEKDGSKLAWVSDNPGWGTGTGSDSGSLSKPEEPERLAADSYTRWYRFRSRGAGGNSDWKYVYHTYARPYAAKIKSVKATGSGTSTTITVKWSAAQDFAHPIDQVRIEYAFVTPAVGFVCPSGNIWSEGTTLNDGGGKDAAQFVVAETIDLDQCLYVRVVTIHDANETASDPYTAKVGALTPPTNLTVTNISSDTHRATVTATNASSVTDSALAVIFRTQGVNTIVGIIPAGETSVTVQCPDWGSQNIAFGVKAFQGSYTAKSSQGGVTVYTVVRNMQSTNVWRNGDVPYEARNLTAIAAPDAIGEVILTWDWDWTEANQAEISWSQNPHAWESTDPPETYTIANTYAAQWRVVGLATGTTWYFAVRLMNVSSDGSILYGDYSEIVSVNLSTSPNVPILALSAAIVPRSGSLTATWDYFSTDGTDQAYAEVFTATVNGSTITLGDLVGTSETARQAVISAAEWTPGETYYLMVRVTSGSGMVSAWSDPVPVFCAEDLVCSIASTSFESLSIPDGDGGYRMQTSLTALPLTLTVTGAGAGGTTTVIIERAEEYPMERPDGTMRGGYDGETIVLYRQIGDASISITADDLQGMLDDGAKYRLIATVEDGYGQTDTDAIEFEVHWSHRAGIPTATAAIVDGVAVIRATAPATYAAGDTVDIYRLSVDRPQLIVHNGAFGVDYVDPYPALGENAGYRFVCITGNKDYITEDNTLAWVDIVGELLDNEVGIIDFDGIQIGVRFNTQLSNRWSKDFKETRYLGGTVRGDWNPSIGRTGTVSVSVPTNDTALVQAMRRLSEYAGICHVRTQDGSSFAADVQVSNTTGYDSAGRNEEYSLSITRVHPQALDGMPYSEWVVE